MRIKTQLLTPGERTISSGATQISAWQQGKEGARTQHFLCPHRAPKSEVTLKVMHLCKNMSHTDRKTIKGSLSLLYEEQPPSLSIKSLLRKAPCAFQAPLQTPNMSYDSVPDLRISHSFTQQIFPSAYYIPDEMPGTLFALVSSWTLLFNLSICLLSLTFHPQTESIHSSHKIWNPTYLQYPLQTSFLLWHFLIYILSSLPFFPSDSRVPYSCLLKCILCHQTYFF